MAEQGNERIKHLGTIDLRGATDQELERLKNLSDDELLRAASSLDIFAVVESNRRLKNALHSEEKSIKWLTVVITVLTFVLVLLGAEALWRG